MAIDKEQSAKPAKDKKPEMSKSESTSDLCHARKAGKARNSTVPAEGVLANCWGDDTKDTEGSY